MGLVHILHAVFTAYDSETNHKKIKGAFLYAELPKENRIVIRLPQIDGTKDSKGQ